MRWPWEVARIEHRYFPSVHECIIAGQLTTTQRDGMVACAFLADGMKWGYFVSPLGWA